MTGVARPAPRWRLGWASGTGFRQRILGRHVGDQRVDPRQATPGYTERGRCSTGTVPGGSWSRAWGRSVILAAALVKAVAASYGPRIRSRSGSAPVPGSTVPLVAPSQPLAEQLGAVAFCAHRPGCARLGARGAR